MTLTVSSSADGSTRSIRPALTSAVAGRLPCSAACTAPGEASRQASEPSVVTTYSRPSRYCMLYAEPQPVPSFHSRVPSAAKQYTEEWLSPANTYSPSGEAAQENTEASHLYAATSAPSVLRSRCTQPCEVPANTSSRSCQPNSTWPLVRVCHSWSPPRFAYRATPAEYPW